MAMFQKYFDYGADILSVCGFPYIELEGEVEDRELILLFIEKNKM